MNGTQKGGNSQKPAHSVNHINGGECEKKENGWGWQTNTWDWPICIRNAGFFLGCSYSCSNRTYSIR